MSGDGFMRLLETSGALSHPATRITLGVAGGVIVMALVLVPLLARRGRVSPSAAAEMRTRTITWAVIAPLVIGPILAGALWTMLLVCALALLCYAEFARATGLFRERLVSGLVVLGIVSATFANIDFWPALVTGVQTVILTLICVLSVLADRPKGYIQRVALGAAAFMLFGVGFSRLGMLANEADYRPILCTLLLCVQMNDVFAYCCGRALGRARALPNTSPGKTIAGHIGALLLTTPLAAWLFHLVFRASALDTPVHLVALGLMVSVGGQLGDLVISSVKRDVGVKDMGAVLPGHGGVLDRCNSILFVAPAVYHYVQFFRGVGVGEPMRIITGG